MHDAALALVLLLSSLSAGYALRETTSRAIPLCGQLPGRGALVSSSSVPHEAKAQVPFVSFSDYLAGLESLSPATSQHA
eukprot:SM000007S20775  [mRNA]  locus=s7:91216:91919:+ [translate_table: standard]